MSDLTDDKVRALLDGATPGRRVQFHGSYCPEAVGTPFTDWDTSHDVSVIRPDGSRYRLAHYKHASDADLSQMAPDLARALLDARAELAATQTQVGDWIVRADEANVKVEKLEAELARVKTDAQAAVARAYEAAAERLDLAEHDAEERDWRSGANAFAALAKGLRALAPADGLAAVDALRAQVERATSEIQGFQDLGRENMRQWGAAVTRAETAEAELAAAQQREAELLAALEDPLVVHLNMVAGKIAKPLPSQLAHIYGEDVIRAALAPTPPADTWHERRTMLPDGDARKGEG